jgi:hypothetical protein
MREGKRGSMQARHMSSLSGSSMTDQVVSEKLRHSMNRQSSSARYSMDTRVTDWTQMYV